MKQVDRSHWYFLIPLFILVILGIYQCFTMAHAINAVDRVQWLYDPAAPGDSATVRNDTLNAMALKAIKAVAVKTDTLVGSLSSVAILDDTLWLNRDSSNCVMVVWFVGTGAGIKYNCTTDSLYWTRDGSTWVQFGTGGGGAGTGDIDAVTAGSGLTGGGTSGSVTVNVLAGWGIKIDNDSVEVNATQLLDSLSSVDRDSTFAAHRSSRWLPYPGVTGQTIGNTTDSGFVEFVDSTSGNSYGRYWCPLFFWEVVPDSAIPTWGRVNAAIGANGGGDITGVLANDWITGSASSGDVSLGINPSILAALYLGGDTTFIDGTFVKIAADTSFVLDLYRGTVVSDSAYPTWGRVNAAIGAAGGGDITSVALGTGGTGDFTSGGGTLNVIVGTSTGLGSTADSIYVVTIPVTKGGTGVTSLTTNGILYGGTTVGVTAQGAVNTVLHGNGSSAPSFSAIVSGDITDGTIAAADIASDAITEAKLKFVDSPVDEDIMTYESTTGDFEWHTPADLGLLTSETGDISSVVAGGGLTGGATSGAATVDAVGGWSLRVFPDSIAVRQISGDSITAGTVADARIATTLFRDSEFTDSVNATRTHSGIWTISGNWVNTANPWADNEVANNLTVDDAGIAATIMRDSEWNDSIAAARTMANVVTITGNWVNTTNPWSVNEGGTGAATFTQNGILYGNGTSAIGVTAQGASGTVLHGNAGTPTFSAVVTGDVTDGTLTGADMATGTIDSVRLGAGSVKAAELDTTVAYVIGNLRTRAANQGLIQSNNFKATDPDSSLKIGGGGGITIGSNITLGTDITDDTAIVTLASEWAGMVLARGYRDDSTKYWDSVTIRGGSDSYGNYIEFGKLGSDTTGTTLRRRHLQVAIPVPMDADTIYDVALSYRVFDGTGGESTYVRLKWSTTPFDSTNIFKTAYTEIDSTNGTTFDTLSAAYARTSVSRGSKIYALVTGLLYDKHVTWIRCYDLIMTYHRRYL